VAVFADGEIRVTSAPDEVGEALCCFTEAVQAVATMVVLADVLHAGGGGGPRIVTRLSHRLSDAGLASVHCKTPVRIDGKSRVHEVRFAYPDRSGLILTQSLRSDPDNKARQVAFDGADIARGYEQRDVELPTLICVYQAPADAKGQAELGRIVQMLRDWFAYVYDVDADADALLDRIRTGVEHTAGPRLFAEN
jgi:hypothetical protein